MKITEIKLFGNLRPENLIWQLVFVMSNDSGYINQLDQINRLTGFLR